jgi:threonine dehydratase
VIESISIEEIRAAQKRIADSVVRTPLIRFFKKDTPAEIYLKLENLQPIGSFKLRGAGTGKASLRHSGLNLIPSIPQDSNSYRELPDS